MHARLEGEGRSAYFRDDRGTLHSLRCTLTTKMASGWGWGNLFGGNAKSQKDAPKNAILGLRGTLDMLSKREKHLYNQMEEQDAVARKNVSSNKGGECHAITSWRRLHLPDVKI